MDFLEDDDDDYALPQNVIVRTFVPQLGRREEGRLFGRRRIRRRRRRNIGKREEDGRGL